MSPRPGVPVRIGDPDGPYRRRWRLSAPDASTAVADLEDDFHRFRVTCRHDGTRVTAVEGETLRSPWTTCVEAVAPSALAGMPLSRSCAAVAGFADPHANCTHFFDGAGLAIAHATTRRAGRGPHTAVRRRARPRHGRQQARLARDDTPVLEWSIGTVVGARGLVDPGPPFDGAPWRGGFIRWAAAHLPPDDAEAAIVLRRACDIGMGRGMDLESFATADELSPIMSGVCYTMQPGTAARAGRNLGTIRDFGAAPDGLLADVP